MPRAVCSASDRRSATDMGTAASYSVDDRLPRSHHSVTMNTLGDVHAPMYSTTLGCRSCDKMAISAFSPCSASGVTASSGSSFTATSLPHSRPRYTSPIAPFPMRSTTSMSPSSISHVAAPAAGVGGGGDGVTAGVTDGAGTAGAAAAAALAVLLPPPLVSVCGATGTVGVGAATVTVAVVAAGAGAAATAATTVLVVAPAAAAAAAEPIGSRRREDGARVGRAAGRRAVTARTSCAFWFATCR